MTEVFIPTVNQIRGGINALEMIDEQVAAPSQLASLFSLTPPERDTAVEAAGAGDDLFAAGFRLGLATARQQRDDDEATTAP